MGDGSAAKVSTIAVGSRQWAARLRKQAQDLTKELEAGYMTLGKILYQVWDTPIDGDPNNKPVYTLWGYDSFADFAEGDLELHRRKAESLRKIWYVLEVELAGMKRETKDKVVALGWTKVRELVRVLNIKNAEKWLERAKTASYPDLRAAVAQHLEELEERRRAREKARQEAAAKGEDVDDDDVDDDEPALPPAEKTAWMHFLFQDEQIANVNDALERAEELSGSDVKSNNISLVALDFLATNDFRKKGDPKARARYLTKLETLMGLRLAAWDKNGNIVHGEQALKKLIKEMKGQ